MCRSFRRAATLYCHVVGVMIEAGLLHEATERLVAAFDPDEIILFGSQARGDAHAHSDFDLLVVCGFDGSRRTLMIEMDRALRGLPFARDIIILTPEEIERDREIPGAIARRAASEGRQLYERDLARSGKRCSKVA